MTATVSATTVAGTQVIGRHHKIASLWVHVAALSGFTRRAMALQRFLARDAHSAPFTNSKACSRTSGLAPARHTFSLK